MDVLLDFFSVKQMHLMMLSKNIHIVFCSIQILIFFLALEFRELSK